MNSAFKTVGDVTTTMLAFGHEALIDRHCSPPHELASYGMTTEELVRKFGDQPDPNQIEDLFTSLAQLNRTDLSALIGSAAAIIADLIVQLAGDDPEVAKASLEAMMLRIRQQEVDL